MLTEVLKNNTKLDHIFDFFNETYSSFEDLAKNPSKKKKIEALVQLYEQQEFPKAALFTNDGITTIHIPQDYHGSITIQEGLCINLKFTFGDCSIFGVQTVLVEKEDKTKSGLIVMSNDLSEFGTLIIVE